MKTSSFIMAAVAGTFLATSGFTVRESVAGPVIGISGEIEVNAAPPAPIVETIPPSPEPGFSWVGGEWAWVGDKWSWERGHWERPPHPGAVWRPHHYEYRDGHHKWTRGGWR